jgi:hypothetical protein
MLLFLLTKLRAPPTRVPVWRSMQQRNLRTYGLHPMAEQRSLILERNSVSASAGAGEGEPLAGASHTAGRSPKLVGRNLFYGILLEPIENTKVAAATLKVFLSCVTVTEVRDSETLGSPRRGVARRVGGIFCAFAGYCASAGYCAPAVGLVPLNYSGIQAGQAMCSPVLGPS